MRVGVHQKGHTVPKQVIMISTYVNSSRYSLRTALCESICYQAKSEQNVRQDRIPRVRHGEVALCTPACAWDCGTEEAKRDTEEAQESMKYCSSEKHGCTPSKKCTK